MKQAKRVAVFAALVARYGNRIVQSAAGQLPGGELVQPWAAPIQAADLPDVQPAAAQIAPMPSVLALTTFTNIVEILNRTRTAQERRSQHRRVCAFAVDEPRDGRRIQAVDDPEGSPTGNIQSLLLSFEVIG